MQKHSTNAGLFATVSLIGADLIAILATPPELKDPLFWFGALWVLLFAFTLLAQDTEGDARRITGIIRKKDNFGLYHYLTGKILNFLARIMAPTTAQKEPPPETGRFAKLEWYAKPRAVDTQDLNRLRASPWSWPVMDFALKLVVIYPIVLMLFQWALSGTATGIGDAPILFAEPREWVRYLGASGFVVLLLGRLVTAVSQHATAKRGFYATSGENMTYASAVAICTATIVFALHPSREVSVFVSIGMGLGFAIGALLFTSTKNSGQSLISFALFYSVMYLSLSWLLTLGIPIFWSLVAMAVPGFIVAFPSLVIGVSCQARKGRWGYLAFFAYGFAAIVALLAFSAPYTSANAKIVTFTVGLLSLLNALFDYVSYAITITLIKLGARLSNFFSLLLALSDALIAYALLVALGSAVVLTFGLIDLLSGGKFGSVAEILADLSDPVSRSNYTWLYLTLFSTLVPTGVHVVIGLFSITTWTPMRAKHWIANQIGNPRTGSLGTIVGGSLAALFGAAWCFGIAFPIYFGGAWVVRNFEWIGLSVLGHVEAVARLFGVI